MFLRKTEKRSKQELQREERVKSLSRAIATRHCIELNQLWWQRLLALNANSPVANRMVEAKIGDQVTSAFSNGGTVDYNPINGHLLLNGKHPIIVARLDLAILHFTPRDDFGRPKKVKAVAILGERGINRLLQNISNRVPVTKGFVDLRFDRSVQRYLNWAVAFACIWVAWDRFGTKTILDTLSQGLSILRETLGL